MYIEHGDCPYRSRGMLAASGHACNLSLSARPSWGTRTNVLLLVHCSIVYYMDWTREEGACTVFPMGAFGDGVVWGGMGDGELVSLPSTALD